MTQKATLKQSGSTKERQSSGSLASAISKHLSSERVSLHTPGHKGLNPSWKGDVTELPGLDELAYPHGALLELERRLARLWGSGEAIISINGASACVIAAVIACSTRGRRILLPRNAHRSFVSALIMTGLEPVWYEPAWDAAFGVWGELAAAQAEQLITQHRQSLAAMVIVSPTYAGAMSDIGSIAKCCKNAGVPLIVDEAHGAHLSFCEAPNAVHAGADLVIHSLHKTLSGLTQTGLLHLSSNIVVDSDLLRRSLGLVQSSSPSYLLLGSIEETADYLSGGSQRVEFMDALAARTTLALQSINGVSCYRSRLHDNAHILISIDGVKASELFQSLAERGVMAEAVLGQGVLLLAGIGTTANDMQITIEAVKEIAAAAQSMARTACTRPSFGEQVMSPREAFLAPAQTISTSVAEGRIAAECYAPCPPGNPVILPGQRILAEHLELCDLPSVRVVLESSTRGDS